MDDGEKKKREIYKIMALSIIPLHPQFHYSYIILAEI